MAEFPGIEEMAKKVAETALDGFEYQGKTIREWAKIVVEQGWIPTNSGKLPENNEEVWITDVGGKVERARFYKEPHPEDGGKDSFACRTHLVYAENVLAWQSILKPEPYKEGEQQMEKVYGQISLDELKQLKTELSSAMLHQDLIDRILKIPDNAKNIDVLMTVFPKADIRFEGRNNELFGYIEFAGDWLDAPYKGG